MELGTFFGCISSDISICVLSQATAEANNLAAVAAAKDLYNKKMEEVGERSLIHIFK